MGNDGSICSPKDGSICKSDGSICRSVPGQGNFFVEDTADEFQDCDRRPSSDGRTPFAVHLKRQGPNWNNIGVVLSPDDSPNYLTIDEVSSIGLIADWNAAQTRSETQVKEGDLITGVNGVSAGGPEMLHRIQRSGKGCDLLFTIDPCAASFGDPLPSIDEVLVSKAPARSPRASVPIFPELKSHFATLDISPMSSDEAIRRHFRRLARKLHPDKNPGDKEAATTTFQTINAAYVAIKKKRNL